ncbi:MAG: UDP-glucose/GDP-mannose dehydrogenase family protein, partial [Bacteroidetes bacterium]
MNIAVVGTGYVGLVTGTCFAETGNNVICVDINEEKVNSLRSGQIPIYEPGLDVLFERNTKEGRLTFTTNLREAVDHAQIIFLALPTPPGGDGSADLSFIMGVARDLAGMINEYKVIVDKSTVPVGTAEKVAAILSEKLPEKMFDVVSNPEFLREGVAVDDFMKPERVVIGTSSDRAAAVMQKLYEPFVRGGNHIIVMDERSAEMTKYAANAFLATKITFINEVANLCERAGANVDQVRRGIGTDSRIGNQFLYPGLGYGGSCFPKDVRALLKTASEFDYDFRILESVVNVNAEQHLELMRRVTETFGEDLTGRHFGIWGLAFKANTDDVRESPAHRVIEFLLERGASVSAFDPEARQTTYRVLGDRIEYCDFMLDTANQADALVVATEWSH